MHKGHDLPYCACGCGRRVAKPGNKYIIGHNNKKDAQSSSNNERVRFKKGNTYGKGRPKGSKNKCTVAAENIIESESGAIARQAVEMALQGHPQMMKLVIERCVPVKKSTTIKLEGMPVIDSVESAGEAADFLLKNIVEGRLSPLDGEILSRILDKRLHALQITEIERELKALKDRVLD